MLIQKRMKTKQTRSHKGYHNIPIYPAPKRRNNSLSSSDSSSNSIKTDENKYDKQWFAEKVQSMIGIGLVLLIFIIITIVIYINMPSATSSLPPENITRHEQLHESINDIISPKFKVDQYMIDSITKINPIQIFSNINDDNHANDDKLAIVFFLSQDGDKSSFCWLLHSISSLLISTSNNNNIDIILFMHYTFSIDKLNLKKLSKALNFKIFNYELSGTLMLQHIIRKLSSEQYDLIMYLDHNAFVLQDLSILFKTLSIDTYNFAAIWSFDINDDKHYNQCLLPSILIININHINKNNIDYIQMLKDEPFCDKDKTLFNENEFDGNTIYINNDILNNIDAMSKKYGIVALPWWYVMDYNQFKMYFHTDRQTESKFNEVMTSLTNPQMIVSWLKYMNVFQSKTHSEPIPFIIDLTKLKNDNNNNNDNDNNDDILSQELSSIYLKGFQFCSSLV